MATVDIQLVQAAGVDGKAIASQPLGHNLLTSSGTSQQTDFAAPGSGFGNRYWSILAISGNIRVKFGPNPTAVNAVNGGFLITAGGPSSIFAAVGGDKVAIIDAP